MYSVVRAQNFRSHNWDLQPYERASSKLLRRCQNSCTQTSKNLAEYFNDYGLRTLSIEINEYTKLSWNW